MAEISSLLTLQGQLALLTLIGFFLARKGIINAQGRKCLTDLLIKSCPRTSSSRFWWSSAGMC